MGPARSLKAVGLERRCFTAARGAGGKRPTLLSATFQPPKVEGEEPLPAQKHTPSRLCLTPPSLTPKKQYGAEVETEELLLALKFNRAPELGLLLGAAREAGEGAEVALSSEVAAQLLLQAIRQDHCECLEVGWMGGWVGG